MINEKDKEFLCMLPSFQVVVTYGFLYINDIMYNGMIMIILNINMFHAHYTVLEAEHTDQVP